MTTITAPVDLDDPDPVWARQITAAVNRMQRRLSLITPLGRLVGFGRTSSNSDPFTASTEIGAMDFPTITGYKYLLYAWAKLSGSTDNDGRVGCQLREDNSSGTILCAGRREPQTTNQGRANSVALCHLYTADADEVKRISLTAVRVTGSADWRRTAGPTYPQTMVAILVAKS